MMKQMENEYKEYIIEMLDKLNDTDETFLKQLCVIIQKHIDRNRGR